MPYLALALIIMGRKGYAMKHTTKTLDEFFKKHLDIDGYVAADYGPNGLQVDNDGSEIKKIAFAVDASMDTFIAARDMGADALFVHHGIFWSQENPWIMVGALRTRVKFLLDNNIALYGVHLPLDADAKLGNNISILRMLGATDIKPFGMHVGKKISFKGTLPTPMTNDEIIEKIQFNDNTAKENFAFGQGKNTSIAVMTGGGAYNALDAINDGDVDVFISGELNHTIYIRAQEAGMNIIAGGHYQTEVWGVRNMMELVNQELGIDVEFIDMPTGM